ncbi:sensor of ECF-type sigma factor [uncultured Winogradskyella sp.]|uniref:sensor of ECF-type sigma factor n=1 Tax=uncultured Winogradskyella sp. TaxID=395353 RepID=UPI002624F237|nr:sensor of ECF-type sigma factor [uncultured Winogradskyella sp.]
MKQLIPIFICLFSILSFAQGGEKMKERIKAQKVAFITEQLELTANEAQKFWPIYNTYESKIDAIRTNKLRTIRKEMRKGDVTENRADELLEQILKAEDAMHKIKQDLVLDLKSVISSKKIIRLKGAEDQFNRKLLERLRGMHKRRGTKD